MSLQDEITNDPLGLGYAAMTDAELETSLNTKNRTHVVSRYVTARTILAECADGASILDKLEAAGAVNSAVKWAFKFLLTDTGIDAGHPATLTMIEALRDTVLTSSEADQLKALSVEQCSRGQELDVVVNDFEIRKARAV